MTAANVNFTGVQTPRHPFRISSPYPLRCPEAGWEVTRTFLIVW